MRFCKTPIASNAMITTLGTNSLTPRVLHTNPHITRPKLSNRGSSVRLSTSALGKRSTERQSMSDWNGRSRKNAKGSKNSGLSSKKNISANSKDANSSRCGSKCANMIITGTRNTRTSVTYIIKNKVLLNNRWKLVSEIGSHRP
jgi:hypothetical protein